MPHVLQVQEGFLGVVGLFRKHYGCGRVFVAYSATSGSRIAVLCPSKPVSDLGATEGVLFIKAHAHYSMRMDEDATEALIWIQLRTNSDAVALSTAVILAMLTDRPVK